jgi:hypothetical protein
VNLINFVRIILFIVFPESLNHGKCKVPSIILHPITIQDYSGLPKSASMATLPFPAQFS